MANIVNQMKRQEEMENNLVRLQGIGLVKGIIAKAVEVGDEIIFNYGYSYKVVETTLSKTKKTVNMVLENPETKETYQKRYTSYRLLAVKKGGE